MFKNLEKLFVFLFLILGFLFTHGVSASSFEIVEIQTRGDGGAYDECVKIRNDDSAPVSLLDFKLQSRSVSRDTWMSRSGDGLLDINADVGEIIVLASSLYSGSDDVWRHTVRWGFADGGGGVRLLNADDVVVAEKYWGSLDPDAPPPEPEDPPEDPPEPDPEPTQPPVEDPPEPEPEPELPPEESADDDADEVGLPAGSPTSPSPSDNDEFEPPSLVIAPQDGQTEGGSTSPPDSSSPSLSDESVDEENDPPPDYSTFQITISEFMPDPHGSDEGEWIEIRNLGEDAVDISGWKIDDVDGGSKPFQIPDGTIIAPHGFLVFYKSQTKLALNNNEDSARLLDPLGEVFQEIEYSDNIVGVSYAVSDDEWSWTTSPTPAGGNIISAPKEKTTKKSSSNNSYGTAFLKTVELDSVRELPKGARVTVKGIVSAPPGSLGSQIFYIAGSGIQIYMYKKDFPDLVLGDEIQISGELSEISGETRIKTKNRSDIVVLSHGEEPLPHDTNIGDVGEELEGSLIKISGEVIEIISNGFYLSDDEGNEIKIYFKTYTGLSPDLVNPGDMVEVTGIVSQTKTGYRLLPRYESDIIVKEQNNKTMIMEEKNMLNSKYKYLAVILGAIFLLVGIKVYKNRKIKLNNK